VGVREVMIGMITVGLVLGIFVGRNTERSRRSFQDRTSSKATYDKARKAVWTETPKAVITVLVIGALLAAIFFGALSLH
jgi:hypothetical protein